MINRIDNINGTDTIYWIIVDRLQYGELQVGQVVESTGEFTEYSDKEEWVNMLISLGIEITGE
jgi:glyceraldehyde-3-phosphate dehydrogenase/erythrose-4-phosphate dehydrogenase